LKMPCYVRYNTLKDLTRSSFKLIDRVRQLNGQSMDADGKVTKRVPKGTSAYQAAWIVDEEDEYSDVDEDDDDQEIMDDDDENVEPAGADTGFPTFDDDEEYEHIEMNGKEKAEDEDEFDAEEEDRQ
jgi:pre-rRNA-processing protein TSR1